MLLLKSPLAIMTALTVTALRACAAQEEFEELCFQYGIELDDVVRPAARCSALRHDAGFPHATAPPQAPARTPPPGPPRADADL